MLCSRTVLSAPASQRCGRASIRTLVPCCCSSQQQEPTQDSSSFRSNLRKGFTPAKRESRLKPAPVSQPNSSSSSKTMVLGGDEFSMEKWREVDKQMNKYPGSRTFTAIGMGTDEFKAAMVQAVASVVGGPLLPEQVTARPSSQGSYISVKIGPVIVESPEAVVEIFGRMKREGGSNLKWLM